MWASRTIVKDPSLLLQRGCDALFSMPRGHTGTRGTRKVHVVCLRCTKATERLEAGSVTLGLAAANQPHSTDVFSPTPTRRPARPAKAPSCGRLVSCPNKLLVCTALLCPTTWQVHAVSTSQAYQSSMMRPDVAARLQAQMSVNVTELAAAKWVFGLLDFDNDGELEVGRK